MAGEPYEKTPEPRSARARERLTPVTESPVTESEPELELSLRVRDPELIDELQRHESPREREAWALGALRVGALALRAARGQVDGDAVRIEVDRMLGGLEDGLARHREGIQEALGGTLREYFDPKSGRFAERVEALVKEDGELARVVRQHVEGEGSTLARTLSAHLGAESPLLRRLDPESGEGILSALQVAVDGALDAQRERILAEFSLDNREGSLARLVAELRAHHGEVGEQLQGRIGEVVKEFSLDDDQSALSRLVARVEGAQLRLSEEFSLDSETSALARLRRELMEVAGRQTERISELEQRVKAELAALVTRREAEQSTPLHGVVFEEALLGWLASAAERAGDVFHETRYTTGLVRQRKVGDAVIELGPEHQAAGARIVFEAKEDAGTTLAGAREELDLARRNRGAEQAVFVLSARSAPATWRPFHRVGSGLFVVWDPEDTRSDVYLEAAFAVARTLCTRTRADDRAELEVSVLERAVRDVERQVEGLEEIRRASDTIEKGNEKVRERARKMRTQLLRAVEALDRCAEAVRQELRGGA